MTAEKSSLQTYLREKADMVEAGLKQYLRDDYTPAPLKEAVRYSLFAGGKRIRPIILLATMEAFGQECRRGLPAACAVEMLHTYSLIHDDLPAMDDDDMRRGKPSNHRVFGEAIAILAGDGLLTHAFETLSRLTEMGFPADQVVRLVRELSRYAGIRGMVGGQAADVLGENRRLSLEELQYIHRHKTGDMIVFCLRAGAILSNVDEKKLTAITRFGEQIGLAFQIHDDILDVVGETEQLGKKAGSDEAKNKSTYPSLIGLDQSRTKLSELISQAKESLGEAGVENSMLAEIADYIITRRN